MTPDPLAITQAASFWLNWGYENNIHPAVLYTIEQHPDLFFIDNNKGIFANPNFMELWQKISDDLNERGGRFVFEKLFMDKYKNWIGEHRVNIIRECYQKGR